MPIDLGRTRRASVPVMRTPRMVCYSLLTDKVPQGIFTLLSLLLVSASPHIMRNRKRSLFPHYGDNIKADGLVKPIEI